MTNLGLRICVVCNVSYLGEGVELTCSQACHEKLVKRHENTFGKFKKVVRLSTGVAYKIPARDIIEKGIKEQDLDKYPLWDS